MKNNQVKAAVVILDYIVKYQNNFISSYLFRFNFPHLLEKGIPIYNLMASNVFSIEFDFDDWPGTHVDGEYISRPYHGSFFDIRNHYNTVFPGLGTIEELRAKGEKIHRVFKIRYTINVLPKVGEYVSIETDPKTGKEVKKWTNKRLSLSKLLSECEDLEIFGTRTIQEVVAYRWDVFGYRFHLFGTFVHFLNMILFNVFVDRIYISG